MKEKIVEQLKEKYRPVAIILHGSRANGMAREKSDWDFFLLFDSEKTPGNFREVVDGQNIEVQSVTLPVGDILDAFGTKLIGAQVLFENEEEGTKSLEDARAFYSKGFTAPESWPDGPNLLMRGKVDGMKDYVDTPALFYKYFSNFYPRALDYWYTVLHGEYSKPAYLALPEIQKRDPEYYDLIVQFANPETSLAEKAKTAEEIHQKLFG
jgi:predicted nucleotidyltransferase